MRKIGILGGSFNPIHHAHLKMASCALKQFDLDDMWLIPAKCPPHKQDMIFDDEHRLNMLRLGISEYPGLSLHLYEYQKEGLSYTVETLRALKEMYPDTDFYYVMGEDSLYDFPKWYQPSEIAALANIIVACRPDVESDFAELLQKRREEFHNPFYRLNMDLLAISSTEIRERLKNGLPITDIVPKTVAAYIEQHHLYQ